MKQKNNETRFKMLEWDSNFFGFKVALIEKNSLKIEEREIVLDQLVQNNVTLGYYFSDSVLEPEIDSNTYTSLLVDKKIPLVKTLEDKKIHPNVEIYKKDFCDEDLIKLAHQAGNHTRFKTDPNIPHHKYEELFKIWIEKSVAKEMATDVVVYRQDGKIIGFATIQNQDRGPYVSLLAVQKEFEGKGISFALMNAVETILFRRGHSQVFGATQEHNRKAMVVYQRYGLQPQPAQYVYHLWKF